jgi:HD superfamily phosphohydrolase
MAKVSIAPLKTEKILVDAVHGYIKTTNVEYQILQLPVFNRLHHLNQMSLGYLVFPCASTSRFQHSLGTMHVASGIIQRLLESLELEWLCELFPEAESESGRKTIIQLVRLAALLHDVGHGPFSHASESIMLNALNETELSEARRLFGTPEKEMIPVHEYCSYKMIMSSEIAEVLTRHGIKPEHVASLLAKEARELPQTCSTTGLEILRAVVSSQLDADKMDYLLRDSYMTGAPYGNVDIDRIVMYMLIRPRKPAGYRLAVDERALPSVEDMLDARFKMYKWVYGHHMVEALDELVAGAMDALIHEVKNIQLEDFSWRNMMAGHMTDCLILNALHYGLNHSESKRIMSIFAGIIDRRYLPVSLLKWHPIDYDRFLKQLVSKSKTEEKNDVLVQKIVAVLRKLRNATLAMQIDGKETQVALFPSPVIRSPYERHPRADELIDKSLPQGKIIYVYCEKQGNFTELTKASPYLDAVNEEWSRFQSYHVAYVIPGLLKRDASKYRQAVEQMVVDRISSEI